MSNTTADAPVRMGAYPELTPVAVLVGYFLGAVIAVSIGYAALILGFSIEGSELAAILGFGILRGMLRRKSIIENNIVQTVASGVNGASSGMMFSVPAIFLLGYAVSRFCLEYVRKPDEQFYEGSKDGTVLWGMTMGQTLTLAMVVGALLILFWPRKPEDGAGGEVSAPRASG